MVKLTKEGGYAKIWKIKCNEWQVKNMSEKKIPENFNMALVIVDSIPVITFAVSMIMIASRFKQPLFYLGALLSTLAGLGKVLWKLIIVVKKKNIYFFYKQFRYSMPLGFLFMVLAVIIGHNNINFSAVWQAVSSFPAGLCFIGAIILFCVMGYCAKALDPDDAKSNWIEQGVNVAAQILLMAGVILACY